MVKKIAIALLCMSLGSSLYARDISESEKFLGLEVAQTELQADRFGEPDYDGDAVEFGFRIGAQTDEWRTMFVFDYYDSSDDDQNVEKGYLMVDYFFLKDENKFRPFIGVNVGYMNYESTLVEESGFLYGAQAGFVVNVMETIDLDLSYRYLLSNADALDHMGSIVFGINYLY